MGLVLWIAIFIKLILDLFGYIDNNFSFDEEGNIQWYEPYKCYYPAKQTELLKLWDEIGLPLLKLERSRDVRSYKTVALVSGWKRTIKRCREGLVAASVWKSGPVRFFGQISTDRNRNRLPIMARPQITGPDRK